MPREAVGRKGEGGDRSVRRKARRFVGRKGQGAQRLAGGVGVEACVEVSSH